MMRTESAAVAEHGARVNCQRRSDEKVREELEGEATEGMAQSGACLRSRLP